MQTNIEITAMEPRVFGVQVTEGTTTTSHRVTVSDGVLDLVAAERDDQAIQETVVRETFKFLLEKESAVEILDQFSLDDIPRYFPSYTDELATRIANL